MSHLSLDDFEWVEGGFDCWDFMHKTHNFTIAVIRNFNGWHVQVLFDASRETPLHVDSLDAAKALAQMTAAPNMEKYHEYMRSRAYSRRIKKYGPPSVRSRVFQVE
jgi:hypothetical protein